MLDFTQVLRPDEPLIHPTCTVKNCTFGAYVELGDHCIAEETVFGDYTYLFGSNDVIFTTLGKFNSIATGVRVNPVNHPMRERAAAHHLTYRAAHYGLGEDDPSIIEWRRSRPVTTAPAPTTAPSPSVTPPMITALWPIHTSFPVDTQRLRRHSMMEGSSSPRP